MQHEREIDALLSLAETGSIIDRLLALPQPSDDADGANLWDRAVMGRFEANLAKQMKSLIDASEGRRDAA